MIQTPVQILIVDDNPEDRTLYQRLLKQHEEYEYHFLQAESGEEGVALYRSAQPDCILLDYQLPDLNGLEFLAELGGEEGSLSIPVIMLTGWGSETIVIEAMRAGVADYLSKSIVSTESLGRAVSNAVAKHRLHRALEEQYRALEQTNAELRRKNEEIQRFYHMLSHELKTPLTSAREFVSIVLEELAGPLSETQREYLSLTKESCDQMTLGLNDLLDTTRVDTGKLHISPHPTSLASVVSQTVAAIAPTAQGAGVHVQHVITPDLPDVLIDEKRIAQVLTNLLSNALKFTPEGGEVVVRVSADLQRPTCVLVAVSDTGRGIELEKLPRIFDRLYQVERDDASSAGGLGLGLYICQELIRLHGGEIWVDSVPGKGTTFCFTVPKHSVCET